jgi:hypothetical protein
MLLQDISQIDPLPRHPVRNHRVRDPEPNPVHGWDGKPEVIALEAHTLKSDRSSKRASRKLARLVTVSRLLFTASKDRIRINTDFLLKLVSDDVDWPDNENRVHGHREMNGRH